MKTLKNIRFIFGDGRSLFRGLSIFIMLVLLAALPGRNAEATIKVDPRFPAIETGRLPWLNTPVTRLPDGRLVAVVNNGVIFSGDGMKTWSEPIQISDEYPIGVSEVGIPRATTAAILNADQDEIIIVWRDPPSPSQNWWNHPDGPVEGLRRDMWRVRSSDGGETWEEPVLLFEEPGYFHRHILLTTGGTLVVPAQYHARYPGRNVIRMLTSTDFGDTWSESANLDIGGGGNHDGLLEPTLVELHDGMIWILMRTNEDEFYESFSEDEGATWSEPRRSGILASSSPGWVERLDSGRLVLAWNRLYPENSRTAPLAGGEGSGISEREASWHRQELSVSVSDDDGLNWRTPIIVARHQDFEGRVAYPYLFEKYAGGIYLFTSSGQGQLQLLVHEEDLLTGSVRDDFDTYTRVDSGGMLSGFNGGWGWGGPWQGDANILLNRFVDLEWNAYGIKGAGVGSVYSQTANHRAIYRNLIEPLSGEIWFSYIFRKGGTGAGGLQFNATGSTSSGGSTPSAWNVLLDPNSNLTVTLGGVTTLVKSEIAGGQDYLVLGRLVTGNAGAFDIWVNPDLSAVAGREEFLASVAPDLSKGSALNPDAILSLGVSAYRGTGSSSVFRFDVLRLSEGQGNPKLAFAEITGTSDLLEGQVAPPPKAAANIGIRHFQEDDVELRFATEPGRLYEVQIRSNGDPGKGSWERLELFEGSGDLTARVYPLGEMEPSDYRVLRSNASLGELPVLYATDFAGPDFETPEGWSLRQGDPFWGTRFEGHYDFDYRFGTSAATFLAVLETEGAEDWTDYLITTSVKTLRAADPVSTRTITPGLVGRIGLGQTSNAYHPRLWLRQDWPASWTEGAQGGRLEIYRLGGPGNMVLSQTSRFLDPDPDPDPVNPLPEPPDVAVRMHFYLLGDDLLASIWDEEGNLLTQSATRDASFSQGAPGIRVPSLRDGIVSYDDFNVYDLSGVEFEIVPGMEIEKVRQLEISFDAPISNYLYQLQESEDLIDWNNVGHGTTILGGVKGMSREYLHERLRRDRTFYRIATTEKDGVNP